MNTRVLFTIGFSLLLLSISLSALNMKQLHTVKTDVEELEMKISSVEDDVDELKSNEVEDYGSRIDDLENDLNSLKSEVEYIQIRTSSY